MAKSSKSRVRRDARVIANPFQGLLDLGELPRSSPKLTQLEDRRAYYPGVYKPASYRDRGKRAFLSIPNQAKPKIRSTRFSHVVKFEDPRGVLVCVRRHRRREVLFATKKAGRGGMKKPRRNLFSNISCRRS